VGEERPHHRVLLDRDTRRVVELVEPELVTDPKLGPAPPHVRFVERRIAGATQYVRMRAASSN
jgi:hypothetical protein